MSYENLFPLIRIANDKELLKMLDEEDVFVQTSTTKVDRRYLDALMAEAKQRGLIKDEKKDQSNPN